MQTLGDLHSWMAPTALLEHSGQGLAGDGVSCRNAIRSGCLVGVSAGDDPLGVGDDGAVEEEEVDVVLGGEQRADVASSTK